MIDKDLLAYLKSAHGFFNICMLGLFCFQAWMGYQIRQARQSGAPVPFDAVRRHRKAGPVFALWGLMGFAAGVTVVLLDKGRILAYPLHFLGGLSLAVCITAAYLASRKIIGADPVPRDRHFLAGLLVLALYVVQAFLGLAILF